MKRYIFILSALLVLGSIASVRAEISTPSYSDARYESQQVFSWFNNGSGSDITSNSVVIIDTSGTAGSTLGMNVTATTTANSPWAIGITDEVIEDGTMGKVCVRGPHKALMTTTTTFAAGVSLVTTTTSGKLGIQSITTDPNVVIARLMSGTATTADDVYPALYWVWVNKD